MRATGWRLENGKIIPPVGKPQSDGNDSGLSAAVGDKRKRELDDAREGESTF
jgi:hypothetical protein